MEASDLGAPAPDEQENAGLTGADAPDEPEAPAAPAEPDPAVEQAPVATERQNVIVGDPGLRNEQQPVGPASDPNTPVRTSAPPPEAQSGTPLAEDR